MGRDGAMLRLMAADDADDGLLDDRIAALAAAPDGNLWIGTWREVAPGQRFAGFGRLTPGDWRLEVEASDRSRAWQGETRVL